MWQRSDRQNLTRWNFRNATDWVVFPSVVGFQPLKVSPEILAYAISYRRHHVRKWWSRGSAARHESNRKTHRDKASLSRSAHRHTITASELPKGLESRAQARARPPSWVLVGFFGLGLRVLSRVHEGLCFSVTCKRAATGSSVGRANSGGLAARIAINEPVHAALAYEKRDFEKWSPSANAGVTWHRKVVSTFDMNSAAALHLQGVGQTLQSPNTGESLQSCGSMRCCLLLPTAMGKAASR